MLARHAQRVFDATREIIDRLRELRHGIKRSVLSPPRDIRNALTVDGEAKPSTHNERHSVDDHLGLLTSEPLIVHPKRMRALMDQRPQPRIPRRGLVNHDRPRLAITPATDTRRRRLEPNRVTELPRERARRGKQMSVAVSSQRLTRRLQRSRIAALYGYDLGPVENRHDTEQQAPLVRLLATASIAQPDGHRCEDPDRALALANAIAELQPRLEPRDEARFRLRQQDQ